MVLAGLVAAAGWAYWQGGLGTAWLTSPIKSVFGKVPAALTKQLMRAAGPEVLLVTRVVVYGACVYVVLRIVYAALLIVCCRLTMRRACPRASLWYWYCAARRGVTTATAADTSSADDEDEDEDEDSAEQQVTSDKDDHSADETSDGDRSHGVSEGREDAKRSAEHQDEPAATSGKHTPAARSRPQESTLRSPAPLKASSVPAEMDSPASGLRERSKRRT